MKRRRMSPAEYARWNVARGCAGKVQYKDFGDACAASKRTNCRIYECPHCTWWHLTSR